VNSDLPILIYSQMLHTYHLISKFKLSFIFQNYRHLMEWYYC